MKITEEKHNHKLTNLLKVFIFSVLMILPFLNVAVRCGYVIVNKNAYQSYEGDVIDNSYYVDTLEVNEEYKFYKKSNAVMGFTGELHGDFDTFSCTNQSVENYFINHKDEINNIRFARVSNVIQIQFYNDNTYLDYWTVTNEMKLQFTWLNTVAETLTNNTNITNINITNSTLDNVFEYSLNKLQEEEYLTWTQNTAVYTGVETMTTQLGITHTVIPMLIVYWFILTIIYVIIDIVLALFTKLTHMIGNKTT